VPFIPSLELIEKDLSPVQRRWLCWLAMAVARNPSKRQFGEHMTAKALKADILYLYPKDRSYPRCGEKTLAVLEEKGLINRCKPNVTLTEPGLYVAQLLLAKSPPSDLSPLNLEKEYLANQATHLKQLARQEEKVNKARATREVFTRLEKESGQALDIVKKIKAGETPHLNKRDLEQLVAALDKALP
jgi:hypothetical protein